MNKHVFCAAAGSVGDTGKPTCKWWNFTSFLATSGSKCRVHPPRPELRPCGLPHHHRESNAGPSAKPVNLHGSSFLVVFALLATVTALLSFAWYEKLAFSAVPFCSGFFFLAVFCRHELCCQLLDETGLPRFFYSEPKRTNLKILLKDGCAAFPRAVSQASNGCKATLTRGGLRRRDKKGSNELSS